MSLQVNDMDRYETDDELVGITKGWRWYDYCFVFGATAGMLSLATVALVALISFLPR
jgi:hypothetical protein